MKIPYNTVILVADGSRMLLLRNLGSATYPDLGVIEHRQYHNPPNRELMSDAPGLSYSTGAPGRSTVDEGDPHQANEDRFLADAAAQLANLADDTSGMIVVAPPDALGELRRHYTADVRGRLLAEIGKDLTKHPTDEITRLLLEYEA